MITELSKVANILLAADDIMIITHKHPDGDTIGSGVALCGALKKLGKRCFVANGDPIPQKLQFLTGGREEIGVEFEPKFIVSVDVAEVPLMGSLETYGDRVDLCIDHHKTNRFFAKETYLDDDAGSVCEIIYYLLGELGVAAEGEIATALYVGLSTDTGCFRYRNNCPKTMKAAAALLEAGVDYNTINKVFFETVSLNRVHLLNEVYANMEIFEDGKLAVSHIGFHDFADGEYDGLSGELRKIYGVVGAVLLRHNDGDEYKASARSNPGFDCAEMCAKFGGGGHEGAAGATLRGTLEDCMAQIKSAMVEELRRIK